MARYFAHRLGNATVVCPRSRLGPPPSLPGVEVIAWPIHGSWLFLLLIPLLAGILRRQGVTHVLHMQWQSALWTLFWPRRAATVHCSSMVMGRELLTSALGPLGPSLCRRVFRRMRTAIPISRSVEKLLRDRVSPHCPVRMAYPGVDPESFRPVDASHLRRRHALEGSLVLIAVTRLVARKNLAEVILTLPSLLEEFPTLRLVIGGTGPEGAPLRELAHRSGLSDKVMFLGKVPEDELAAHYNLGDVYVLPSRSDGKDFEGFGIVFLEAGACGVPVVGSASGGILDAVDDGHCGLLVPEGDRQALREAIASLLRDPVRRKAMGAFARQRILNGFTWNHAGDAILRAMEGTVPEVKPTDGGI